MRFFFCNDETKATFNSKNSGSRYFKFGRHNKYIIRLEKQI